MTRESVQPTYKLFSQMPGCPVGERGWKEGEGAACRWVEEAKLADPQARHWYRPWVRSPF